MEDSGNINYLNQVLSEKEPHASELEQIPLGGQDEIPLGLTWSTVGLSSSAAPDVG